jgi:hypothetical protein
MDWISFYLRWLFFFIKKRTLITLKGKKFLSPHKFLNKFGRTNCLGWCPLIGIDFEQDEILVLIGLSYPSQAFSSSQSFWNLWPPKRTKKHNIYWY